MKITILGCGWSSGVPVLGCDCPVCASRDPRNRRRRASILVASERARVLVDTSPDLRAQLLDAGVCRIDGVVYTHAHADHLHGIDDLRAINYIMEAPIAAYADAATLDVLERRFGYALGARDPARPWWVAPRLAPERIDGPFRVVDIPVVPFPQDHGAGRPSLGLRFGPAAYSTDAHELGSEAFAALAGVRLWIVDCIGYEPHATHAHLAKALGWIERVRPELAVLTHMSHRLDYARLADELPAGVVPAHDGMVLDLDHLAAA